MLSWWCCVVSFVWACDQDVWSMSLAQLIFSCLLVILTPRSCLYTMSSEAIDLTIEISLPEEVKQDWIPLDVQSVPHLFQFTRYPPQHMLYHAHYDLSQQLYEEVTNFKLDTLLSIGPPSPELSDNYQAAIKATPHHIYSFTLTPVSGHPVRLPIWVLDYWREIRHEMGYQNDWKRVLIWLRGFSRSESITEIHE